MFSSVMVLLCWGLNHRLLLLPPFPLYLHLPYPSIHQHQTISHYITVVICHFLTNLYLTHFKLTRPTVSQIANYAAFDGEVSWMLLSNCPLLYAFVYEWVCSVISLPSGPHCHCKWSLIARQGMHSKHHIWPLRVIRDIQRGERVSNSDHIDTYHWQYTVISFIFTWIEHVVLDNSNVFLSKIMIMNLSWP